MPTTTTAPLIFSPSAQQIAAVAARAKVSKREARYGAIYLFGPVRQMSLAELEGNVGAEVARRIAESNELGTA